VFHLSRRACAMRAGKCAGTGAQEVRIDSAVSVFRRVQSRNRIVYGARLAARACPVDNFSVPMLSTNRKSAHHSAGLLLFWVLCICPWNSLFVKALKRLDQTRRCFGGRQPLWGTGVTSRITVRSSPIACKALTADSRPAPGPFTKTSTSFSPWPIACLEASCATICAAYAVLLREPLKPTLPALDHP